MHARISLYKIRTGKQEEFQQSIESLKPTMRQQKGFCGLVVLRGSEISEEETTVISIWDSLEDLRGSEKNLFFYQAMARTLTLCEGFPAVIREHEVLATEFAAKH